MTVTNTTNKKRETGNGVIVAFSFSFKIFASADISVYKVVTSTGVATLQTITTDYSVTINSVTEGGTVTYVTAPLATEESLIIRELTQTQDASLPTESNFPEATVENALDKNTMMIQELQEAITRSVKLSSTSAVTTPPDIPDPSTGKALKWKSDGTLENSTNDPDTQTTAAAASAAAALVSETAAAASAASTADFTNEGTWSALTTYALSNIVTYTQSTSILGTFQSLQASNLNQNPETATLFWEKLAEGGAGSPVLMSNIVQTSGEATLDLTQENFIDGCWLSKNSDTVLQVGPGSAMINGKLRRNTTATTATLITVDAGDYIDVFLVADASATTFTIEQVDSGTVPGGGTAVGTNSRRIGWILVDGSGDLSRFANFRQNHIEGWHFYEGTNATGVSGTITFGVTFSETPTWAIAGDIGSHQSVVLNDITDPNVEWTESTKVGIHNLTTTNMAVIIRTEVGSTLNSNDYYAFSWRVNGRYS